MMHPLENRVIKEVIAGAAVAGVLSGSFAVRRYAANTLTQCGSSAQETHSAAAGRSPISGPPTSGRVALTSRTLRLSESGTLATRSESMLAA
jgi:hypothetical protein